MSIREYRPEDRDAVFRIWQEIGWLKHNEGVAFDMELEAVRVLVAGLNGQAEAFTFRGAGTVQYLAEELPFCVIAAVGTSRLARKQGFAGRVCALSVAKGAQEGALVAGLGMFDQGYYDRLGFGTGGYNHRFHFDPSDLLVPATAEPPRRLTAEDWEALHTARLRRLRCHGSVNLLAAQTTRLFMLKPGEFFALGYPADPAQELTHCMCIHPGDSDRGPYRVEWMAYRTHEQYLQLLGLLKALGDQVYSAIADEPSGLQFQVLLREPFRRHRTRKGGDFPCESECVAWWQMRMLDVPGCLARTHLSGEPVRFNLRLSDPIEARLPADEPWRGVAGDYVVTLGPESSAETGQDASLPTLKASVNAFTRLWLGVRPATGLAVTDDLNGPESLLRELDRVMHVPEPKTDWGF